MEAKAIKRIRFLISGQVQGVGFRPFVFNLANKLGLFGYVSNSGSLVKIEAEGDLAKLSKFKESLSSLKPPRASIAELRTEEIPVQTSMDFRIVASDQEQPVFEVPPDVATCDECLSELRDSTSRFYRYPFVHCSVCGPRWSLIESLSYDRERTSLRDFPMCSTCLQEYRDPTNRRFHAQTLTCPKCGPKIFLRTRKGEDSLEGAGVISETVARLKSGQIAAIKGVGGYQLWAKAFDEQVVRRLRLRKNRPAKPFAVMVPDSEMADRICDLSEKEREILKSPAAPIVLLSKKKEAAHLIAEGVAPENPDLGLMFPCSPLQNLLFDELQIPMIATSGNISGELIAIDDEEAFQRLSGIADFFLYHNRRILRALDDSVVRVVRGDMQVLRLGRGLAPSLINADPIWPGTHKDRIALGADLKSAMAVSRGKKILLSQYLGELESRESLTGFQSSLRDFQMISSEGSVEWIRDLHPDYLSGSFAPKGAKGIQHHRAHAVACMVEHNISPPALAVVFDGTGFGGDGSVWGGEIFRISKVDVCDRIAALKTFRLLGGEAAIRDPRRVAFSLLDECGLLSEAKALGYSDDEIQNFSILIQKAIHSPLTSSAGRLFDGVSALLDLFEGNYEAPSFEGQAAMRLEFKARKASKLGLAAYRFEVNFESDRLSLDWRPMISELVSDLKKKVSVELVSRKFHSALVDGLVSLLIRPEVHGGIREVVLSGGCFQNKILLEELSESLERNGFQSYWPRKIPVNDGGIALGQIVL